MFANKGSFLLMAALQQFWVGFNLSRFLEQKFMLGTELSAATKLCEEQENPTIANVPLAVGFLLEINVNIVILSQQFW